MAVLLELGLNRLNKKFGNDLAEENLLKTGGYDVHSKSQNKDRAILKDGHKLTKEQFSNFEFLNAGVASYSTYIYLKKIKSVLNANKWLKVSSVVVLHDKSDLRDDLVYLKMNKPSEFEIVDMKYKNRRKYFFYEDLKNYSFWRFYRKQTIIGLLLDNIGNRIEDFLEI